MTPLAIGATGIAIAGATYVLLCVGMYLALQPFGFKLFYRFAWPLLRLKRSTFGVAPLLVEDGPMTVGDALFDGRLAAGFEGQVLQEPNLVAVLPADVTPRQGAESLKELLTVSVARRLTGEVKNHRTVKVAAGHFRHIFDLGWTQPEFLSFQEGLSETISIIAPGSGFDDASQIMARTGYHERIVDQFPGQVLVYVRPNNDSRQIVYRGKRANFDYLFTTLIGMNSIYSYWYIQELIETITHLARRGGTITVGGLSQGGEAAMLVGAVTEATLTVCLSSYLDLSSGILGNQYQILIPGARRFMLPEAIAPLFHDRRLIFSFGRKDLPVFQHEAETQKESRKFAMRIPKFRCVIHPGGHAPPENLKSVIEEMLCGS